MSRGLANKKFKASRLWWVHVAAILAVAAWGTSFVNTKVLLNHQFNPVEIYVFRCAIAYVLLLCISHKRIMARSWRHELLFVLCGLCGGSIYFLAENTALIYTSTTNVSLITSTSPLITALLVGMLYRDERPSKGLIVGSVIAMSGVAMVIFNGAGTGHGSETPAQATAHGVLGDSLSLLAAVCWSIYCIILRKFHAIYSAAFVTRKTFFYGLITALPFLLLEPSKLTLATFRSPEVWVNLLALAVVCSTLAFVIWSWVVGRIGAVKAGNYLYFQAIFTLLASYLILHEPIHLLGALGCVVTILGVFAGEKLSKNSGPRMGH